MPPYIRSHKTTLLVLIIIIGLVGFLTYNFVSVSGVFSDLKNDLKTIEPEEGSAYQDLEGNQVHLNKYKGEVLVVNSWASWSPYSKDELVVLDELQEKYDEDVAMLAINRKESLATINAYLDTFTIDSDGLVFLFDPTDHFYKASGGYAMPETIVYGKDGTVKLHTRGVLDKDLLDNTIQDLLK